MIKKKLQKLIQDTIQKDYRCCEDCGGLFDKNKMQKVMDICIRSLIHFPEDIKIERYYCQNHKKNYDTVQEYCGEVTYLKTDTKEVKV